MSAPASPQPSSTPGSPRLDAERLEELNAQLSETIKELIVLHTGLTLEETPKRPLSVRGRIQKGGKCVWRFLRTHRAAFSELCIMGLTVLSIWYAVRAINLAEDALNIGQSWSKTSYENALVNTWSAVQAACKENRTVFPVSDAIFKNWEGKPGVECTSKETCVCEVLEPSAYVGDQILSVYYPFLNNSD